MGAMMSRGEKYYEHRFYGGSSPWTGVRANAVSSEKWVEFMRWINAWRDYLDAPHDYLLRDGTDVTDGVTGPVTAAAKTPPAHRSTS